KAERAVKKDNQITYKDNNSSTGNIKLDRIINKLSVKAKKNKKALSIDMEIEAMERFLDAYQTDYLYENYKLPKEKAPYFALQMINFMDNQTNLKSNAFKMLMEEQLLNFKYD